MAQGLGLFVPQQGRALLGFSDFGWKTPENENLRSYHISLHSGLCFPTDENHGDSCQVRIRVHYSVNMATLTDWLSCGCI